MSQSLWEKIKEQWRLYWYGDRSALEELQDRIAVEWAEAEDARSTLERLGAEVRKVKALDTEVFATTTTDDLWGEPFALDYNEIQEAAEAIANWGFNARDIETINWWEEHDMSNIDTSTAEIRHDEIEVNSYWEYDVQDGEGDLWAETHTDHYVSEAQILGDLRRTIDSVRQSRWYNAEDYPEPLTIVKRHVRVTTERTGWEEA